MTIGALLKQYRLENGKTQKEWAAGIVSPSYYSKVEQNKHRITAEDLIAVLRANQIGLWDFFQKLDDSEQQQFDEFKFVDHAINQAWYQNDQAKLKEIRQYVEDSTMANQDKWLLYLDAVEVEINNQPEKLSAEKRARLQEWLFDFTDFDETKLRVYINLMPFYDLDSNLLFSKKVIAKLQKSDKSRHQTELLGIIGNLLIDLIKAKRYEDTGWLIEAAAKVATRPELFFYKNALLVLENMVNYHFDHQDKYLEKCEWAIKNFTLIGMPEYGSEVDSFFRQYCDQERWLI